MLFGIGALGGCSIVISGLYSVAGCIEGRVKQGMRGI